MKNRLIAFVAVSLLAACAATVCRAADRRPPTDLSASGTANCYIVPSAGSYRFQADVKGNSAMPLDGTPVSAEMLWEADGSGKPVKGHLIKVASLRVADGYVSFSTAGPFSDGNALIAVRDASGTVLWSWHIWLCAGFDAASSAQAYANSAGLVMDRNLGATSASKGNAKARGLHYQWGRKDPFPACATGAVAAEDVISGTDNLGYSIAHPETFIYGKAWPCDWYCTDSASQNDALWSSAKTAYDPCPAGWRVPDGDTRGLWSTAFGNTYYDWSYEGDWDDENAGMDFSATHNRMGSAPMIWYPAAGSRDNLSGTLQGVGDHGYYWSASPFGSCSHCLCFFYFGGTTPYCHLSRAYGQSVRCQLETK